MTQAIAVTLRPVTPADEGPVAAFLGGLSLRSRYQRFCSAGTAASKLARRLVRDDPERCGVVACDDAGTIVGHAEYLILAAATAEVAVVVADAHQGRGIGTALLAWLDDHAAAHGVSRLVATVLPGNLAMTRLFTRRFGASVRDLGDELRIAFASGGRATRASEPAALPLAA